MKMLHLIVAVGEELSEDSRGLWIIVWKCFKLHRSADPQPPQLAAVPPVVNLKDEKQHTQYCDSASSAGLSSLEAFFFQKMFNSHTLFQV